MDPFERLVSLFSSFPGIGPRQAARFVYFLLSRGAETRKELVAALTELETNTRLCEECKRFFRLSVWQAGSRGEALCPICTDESRDRSTLLIVSFDSDLLRIEKSGQFKGMYFVLGGIVPVLDKNPEEKVRQRDLLALISKKISAGELKEIIMAANATPDGENTADYVYGIISPLLRDSTITVSSFGRGFSTGTEIEYSDPDTIKYALRNRTPLE